MGGRCGMSDLRMKFILGQLQEIEENVRGIKATWGNTITTLDNIKTSLKADRQKAIDEAYQKGFEAGQHEATTLEYQQGLNDAWGTIIKIALIPYAERSEIFDGQQDILSIVQKFSPSEAIAKLREYEQQKADEIKVGDEVYANTPSGKTQPFIIIKIYDGDDGKYYTGINTDGNHVQGGLNYIKTGRHFPQVVELLKAMKGGDA
jgi:hypothetical protein